MGIACNSKGLIKRRGSEMLTEEKGVVKLLDEGVVESLDTDNRHDFGMDIINSLGECF